MHGFGLFPFSNVKKVLQQAKTSFNETDITQLP